MATATSSISKIYVLEQRFAGVSDPEQMGTSGLIAWVIVGKRRGDWNRFRKAITIIRRRRGSVEGFGRALLGETFNHAQREKFAGYIASMNARTQGR